MDIEKGYLLGVSMKTGKLVYSDDPALEVGDIISNEAVIAFDSRLDKVVGAHPYSWHKVKDIKKPGPQAKFLMKCPGCLKMISADNLKDYSDLARRHVRGNHT